MCLVELPSPLQLFLLSFPFTGVEATAEMRMLGGMTLQAKSTEIGRMIGAATGEHDDMVDIIPGQTAKPAPMPVASADNLTKLLPIRGILRGHNKRSKGERNI
jgi:hypothetical protein